MDECSEGTCNCGWCWETEAEEFTCIYCGQTQLACECDRLAADQNDDYESLVY